MNRYFSDRLGSWQAGKGGKCLRGGQSGLWRGLSGHTHSPAPPPPSSCAKGRGPSHCGSDGSDQGPPLLSTVSAIVRSSLHCYGLSSVSLCRAHRRCPCPREAEACLGVFSLIRSGLYLLTSRYHQSDPIEKTHRKWGQERRWLRSGETLSSGSGVPEIEGVRWCGTPILSLLEHPSATPHAGNMQPRDRVDISFRVHFSIKLSGHSH